LQNSSKAITKWDATMSRDVHILLVLAFIGGPGMVFAADIVVGGPVGWGLGVFYNEVEASVGDVLVCDPVQIN
jgi:hypothetical protein